MAFMDFRSAGHSLRMDPAPLSFPKILYSVIHILVIPRLFDEKGASQFRDARRREK
jgi:hypothetical protein